MRGALPLAPVWPRARMASLDGRRGASSVWKRTMGSRGRSPDPRRSSSAPATSTGGVAARVAAPAVGTGGVAARVAAPATSTGGVAARVAARVPFRGAGRRRGVGVGILHQGTYWSADHGPAVRPHGDTGAPWPPAPVPRAAAGRTAPHGGDNREGG